MKEEVRRSGLGFRGLRNRDPGLVLEILALPFVCRMRGYTSSHSVQHLQYISCGPSNGGSGTS
jgi:hypothetical protein